MYGATSQYMGAFFPPLMTATKDIDLRVKYAAEKAMWQLCEGPTPGTSQSGSNIFQQYLTRADNETQRFLKDYYNRILSKMTSVDSDEE